jgi:hypothetical protein
MTVRVVVEESNIYVNVMRFGMIVDDIHDMGNEVARLGRKNFVQNARWPRKDGIAQGSRITCGHSVIPWEGMEWE